jgi:diacylglycerol kinase (ATP)
VVQRIKLIANPVAGGGAAGKIRRARRHLEGRGCLVDLTLTAARGDATEAAAAAREGGFDRIIVAGGDGTLNEAINGLAPSSLPLGFLPLGTTNVFALEVGIPFSVEKACDIALDGVSTPVCLGVADGTRFLLMAGIGFDAEVVFRVSAGLKRWTGKLAYLLSAFSVLMKRAGFPIEVECEDGTVLPGCNLIIGNARLYAGRFSITPEASLTEDGFDVCLFQKRGRWSLVRSVIRVVTGKRLSSPEVRRFKTRCLTVRGPGVPVQVDGDYLGRLPMSFQTEPKGLTLVLPRR